MAVVACSGFPVPVSRYFREFEGVEISETELGIPGAGTVRRWLREAPEGFVFTLPIVSLVIFFILAGVAGVVAAIPPARRAAKVDVLRAVTTE